MDLTKLNDENCMISEKTNSTKMNVKESMVAENGQKSNKISKTPTSMVVEKSQNSEEKTTTEAKNKDNNVAVGIHLLAGGHRRNAY